MATRNRGQASVSEAVKPVEQKRAFLLPSEDPEVIAFRFFKELGGITEGSRLFPGGGHQGESSAEIFGELGNTYVSRVWGHGRLECFYRSKLQKQQSKLQPLA